MNLDSTREELEAAQENLAGVLEQANLIANWQMEHGNDKPTELDWKILTVFDQITKALDLHQWHVLSLYKKLGEIK